MHAMTSAQLPQTGPKQVQRDERGRIVSGALGGGRPPTPDFLKARSEEAIRVCLAAATGRTVEGDPPAAVELAARCSDRVRLDAAKTIWERVYGKVTDVVEIQGDPIACIRRVVVDVGGVTPVFPPEDDENS